MRADSFGLMHAIEIYDGAGMQRGCFVDLKKEFDAITCLDDDCRVRFDN